MIGLPSSDSYEWFRESLREFNLLTSRARRLESSDAEFAVALARAQPVLLCSIVEGYVEQLFLETWSAIDRAAPPLNQIPDGIKRLLFEYEAGVLLDARGDPNWITMVRAFLDDIGSIVPLDGEFNLKSSRITRRADRFRGVSSLNLVALFRYLGCEDVFTDLERLTSGQTSANVYRLQLDELVDRRNEIAHGDVHSTPALEDNLRYCANARTICRLLDVSAGNRAMDMTGDFPWTGPPRSCAAIVQFPIFSWLF